MRASKSSSVSSSVNFISDRRRRYTQTSIECPKKFSRVSVVCVELSIGSTLKYQTAGGGKRACIPEFAQRYNPFLLLRYWVPSLK